MVTTILTTPPAPVRLDPPQQECLQRHMAELIDTRRPTYQPVLKPGQKIADGTDKARGHFGQVVVEEAGQPVRKLDAALVQKAHAVATTLRGTLQRGFKDGILCARVLVEIILGLVWCPNAQEDFGVQVMADALLNNPASAPGTNKHAAGDVLAKMKVDIRDKVKDAQAWIVDDPDLCRTVTEDAAERRRARKRPRKNDGAAAPAEPTTAEVVDSLLNRFGKIMDGADCRNGLMGWLDNTANKAVWTAACTHVLFENLEQLGALAGVEAERAKVVVQDVVEAVLGDMRTRYATNGSRPDSFPAELFHWLLEKRPRKQVAGCGIWVLNMCAVRDSSYSFFLTPQVQMLLEYLHSPEQAIEAAVGAKRPTGALAQGLSPVDLALFPVSQPGREYLMQTLDSASHAYSIAEDALNDVRMERIERWMGTARLQRWLLDGQDPGTLDDVELGIPVPEFGDDLLPPLCFDPAWNNIQFLMDALPTAEERDGAWAVAT